MILISVGIIIGLIIGPFLTLYIFFKAPLWILDYIQQIPCYFGIHHWSNNPKDIETTGRSGSIHPIAEIIDSFGRTTTGEFYCFRCGKTKRVKLYG